MCAYKLLVLTHELSKYPFVLPVELQHGRWHTDQQHQKVCHGQGQHTNVSRASHISMAADNCNYSCVSRHPHNHHEDVAHC